MAAMEVGVLVQHPSTMDRNQLCRHSRSRAFSCNYLFCLVDLLRSKYRVRRVVLMRALIGYWQKWSRVSTMIGQGEIPFKGTLLRLMILADMKYKTSRAMMAILACMCYRCSPVYMLMICAGSTQPPFDRSYRYRIQEIEVLSRPNIRLEQKSWLYIPKRQVSTMRK